MRARWSYEQQMQWAEEKAREQIAREAIRADLTVDHVLAVKQLTSTYPWMSPGVVAGLARQGVDSVSPGAEQVAQLDFANKVQTQDWSEPGDPIYAQPRPTVPEEPPVPPGDVNAQTPPA